MKKSECKEIFALLSQYLDRELPDDVCQHLESHISDCPPCVEFVESLKKSVELCRSCKSMDTPAPLPAADREKLFAAYQKALANRQLH
jgi:anti-sigma factor RsiW